ncbi:hypothetical protein FED29_020590, partial [Aeromonas veronii]|nr:hypothetical protein [Aeromonas veronii]
LFCLATNQIAQTGLSSLPPVIYYSEQLFSLTALTAEFTVGEGKLMTHDEPCSMAPDDKHDLMSGTCSHLP